MLEMFKYFFVQTFRKQQQILKKNTDYSKVFAEIGTKEQTDNYSFEEKFG